MAKRGYRGKHPNNDMKVAPTSFNAANYDKLTKEYNKTGAKNKYDYIKSHDGFYPQGTATIHFGGVASAGETVTIVSTDGTSKAYVATAGTADITVDPAEFSIDTGATENATSLIAAINAVDSAAVAATADDALDTAGVMLEGANTVFTMKGVYNNSISGTPCTITIDITADPPTDPTGTGANAIAIGVLGDTNTQVAAKLISAINGVADDDITYSTSGVCGSDVGINGVTASAGTNGTTQIDIAVDTVGAHGNGTLLVYTSGENIIDDATTGGGEDLTVPGHKGKITAVTGGSGKVTLTQVEPGPHGNTSITVSTGQPSGGSQSPAFVDG